MNSEKTLDISWGTIWKFFLFALLLYVLYQIREVLVWFFFALIISFLFKPAIDFLRKLRIPKTLAVSLVYLGFLAFLAFIFYFTASLFLLEIGELSKKFPQYFEKISPFLKELGVKASEDINTFISNLNNLFGSNKIITNIFNFFFVIFGGIFATIFILTLSIYLSLEEGVEKILILFFPKKYENYLISLWHSCQTKVDKWFFSRILACLFVGLISFITFLIFNISYPFTLALLAGFLNFIPIIGPIITGILIFVIVALDNLAQAFFVLIAFILIQMIENNLLTPILSKKIIGIPSFLVLLSLTIGGILFGFLGAILSIPLVGVLYEFLKEFLEKRKKEKPIIL